MKTIVNDILDKSEIKFWMGIIAVIVSILLSSNTIITRIAVVEIKLENLTETTREVNNKFSAVYTDNARQEISITKIKTFLKLD